MPINLYTHPYQPTPHPFAHGFYAMPEAQQVYYQQTTNTHMHSTNHASNHPSIQPSVRALSHRFKHPPFHSLTIRPSTHPLIHPIAHSNNPSSIHPLVHTSIHPPIQTTFHLSIDPPIHPFTQMQPYFISPDRKIITSNHRTGSYRNALNTQRLYVTRYVTSAV